MANSTGDLYEQYGEETVKKAFFLQQHIYEEGLRGIDFTGSAENAMREVGDDIVKENIEKQFVREV